MSILKKFSKRVTILATLGLLVVAGSAVAYFTAQSSGAGTGSGTVGARPAPVNLVLGAFMKQSQPALVPGTSNDYTISTVWNGSGKIHVGTITVVPSVDTPHANAGCLATDFSMGPIAVNEDLSPSAQSQALGTGTLSMANTSANQDACAGATISLGLSSN